MQRGRNFHAIELRAIVRMAGGIAKAERRLTKYAVTYGREQVVAYIPDFYRNPKNVARLLANYLNNHNPGDDLGLLKI